jgi:ABC-type transporter Mla maintaining outer membrane lipid asymmetry ATPase subunit MlaF
MRTAEYMGVLFRSGLVKFASKEEMTNTQNPIIRQFLAGRARGPIGMDEMATDNEWQDDEEGPDETGILSV